MAIPDWARENFHLLQEAQDHNSLALVESYKTETGESVYLVCAVRKDVGPEYTIIPIAEMISGDPYSKYADPSQAPPSKKDWTP